MLDLIGYLLSGLGMFFVGIFLVDKHLQRLTGRRLRTVFLKLTDTHWQAAWWGFCIGAITQTASAITFISISLVNSGLLKLRRALTVLNWSNPGTCLLIFFLTLPLDIFVAYLVGVAGLFYAFQQPRRFRDAAGFAFGIGLLFFGLLYLEDYGDQLKDFAWFRELISFAGQNYLLVFVVATLLTMLAQSGNAVVLVVLVLVNAGLLGLEEAVVAVYGANLGASLITHLLTLRLKGTPKQLAMFQVLYGWIGTAVMLPLFFFETWTDLPLVMALLEKVCPTPTMAVAVANLLWCGVTTLVIAPFESPFAAALERCYPPREEEADRRPRYLYPHCDEQPEVCLDLIYKEQIRLARRLLRYLDLHGEPAELRDDAFRVHEDFRALSEEVSHYLGLLVHRDVRGETARHLRALLERLDILNAVEGEFYKTIPMAKESFVDSDGLAERLLEGFDAAARVVVDGIESADDTDLELAHTVTEDGGETVSRLRANFIESAGTYDASQQAGLLRLVAGIERLIWLMNSLVRNAKACG